MFGNVLMFLMALVFVVQALQAIRSGEFDAKGSVVRRADSPIGFYLLVGAVLLFAAVGFDIAFELGLLERLVNLGL
jgi:hypothetical protein